MILLEFLLVAGVTAVAVVVVSCLVVWLTERARKRRHAAEAMMVDAGSAQVSE